MHISSNSNAKLSLVRKLSTKKGRDESGKFVVEGTNLIYEAIERDAKIDFILVSDGYDTANIERELEVRGRTDMISEIHTMEPALFEKLTDAEYGIKAIAVINKAEIGPEELLAQVSDGDNIIILDRVQDPGNIGSVIRTAAATGYRAVICIKGTGDVYSPKVLRSTAGLIYAVPIVYVESASEAVDIAHRLKKQFAVMVPEGGSEYYKLDLSHDIALVVGNEGNGVSDEVLRGADIKLSIPMHHGVESLNAAVSAGIIMYESFRKNN